MILRFCWSCVSVPISPCVPQTEHFPDRTFATDVAPQHAAEEGTPLKKTALVLATCAWTLLILLPAVSPVNTLSNGTPLPMGYYTHLVIQRWWPTVARFHRPSRPRSASFSSKNFLMLLAGSNQGTGTVLSGHRLPRTSRLFTARVSNASITQQ
jgi:hypothetical protein